MKVHQNHLMAAYGFSHHGVISRARALELGLTTGEIQSELESGRWHRLQRGVYSIRGESVGPEARLLAACLAAGDRSAASHRSAAWLWELRRDTHAVPTLTLPLSGRSSLAGVEIHRRQDLDGGRVSTRRGIPVTDPLRTLVDLGEAVGERDLDDAVDCALATQLLSVAALEAEIGRLARRGRRGAPALRAALRRRGLAQAPHPSVLESRTLRLLRRWGFVPLGVEVAACDGRYRLDILLRPKVALEVDGYAYHWSPEAKAADSHRRNELRVAGVMIIESDWVTVTRRAESLRRTITATLEAVDGRTAAG